MRHLPPACTGGDTGVRHIPGGVWLGPTGRLLVAGHDATVKDGVDPLRKKIPLRSPNPACARAPDSAVHIHGSILRMVVQVGDQTQGKSMCLHGKAQGAAKKGRHAGIAGIASTRTRNDQAKGITGLNIRPNYVRKETSERQASLGHSYHHHYCYALALLLPLLLPLPLFTCRSRAMCVTHRAPTCGSPRWCQGSSRPRVALGRQCAGRVGGRASEGCCCLAGRRWSGR